MENDEKSKKKLQEAINKPRKSIAGKKGAGLRQRPARPVYDAADIDKVSKQGNVITGINFTNPTPNSGSLINGEFRKSHRTAEVRGDVETLDGTVVTEIYEPSENFSEPEVAEASSLTNDDGGTNEAVLENDDASKKSSSAFKLKPDKKSAHKVKFTRNKRIVVVISSIVAVLLFAVIASLSYFAYATWYAHDDTKDIVGNWTSVQGVPVDISTDEMILSEDLVYKYSLNVSDKKISYNVKEIQGYGLYSFSKDRLTLYIQEAGTFAFFDEFLYFYNIKQRPMTQDDAVSVFTKVQ